MKFEFPADKMKQVHSLLQTSQNIVITTHHRPDGDAIGSSLALYHFLVQEGHKVTVITPDEAPSFLAWMPGFNTIMVYEKNVPAAVEKIKNASIIFCLDFNRIDRLDRLGEPVAKSSAKKILIDHHLDPETTFDFSFSFPKSCATCELIYYFISGLNGKFSTPVAECIYTGIMTDTQSFRFSTMTADTHRIIAALIEAGVQNHIIHENVYDSYSENRLRLLGYSINNKLKIYPEHKTALITLTKEELDRFHYVPGDSEGFVNYALAVDRIRMAACFTEGHRLIKISLRSKGNFSVKKIAENYFEGGGHMNAAGGKSRASMDA